MSDHYVMEERRIIHPSGWMFYVADYEEGIVEIGYKEKRDGEYVTLTALQVAIEMLPDLAESMLVFSDREGISRG